MEIPVLLEPSPGGGFRARSGDPLNLTAEGNTPDTALHHLRDLIAARIAAGSKLTTLSVPTRKEPRFIPAPECTWAIPSSISGVQRSRHTASRSRTIQTYHERDCPRYQHPVSLPAWRSRYHFEGQCTSREELAITVITVEEELAGWYNLLRKVRDPDALASAYQHLAEAIPVLARWQILPMTRTAITRYETLKSMNLNVRKMDLRIAAIVLEHAAILATRNLRDFQRVPGLVTEAWTG